MRAAAGRPPLPGLASSVLWDRLIRAEGEKGPVVFCPSRARKVMQMCRWIRWFTLSVFAALMAVPPVLAANEQAPAARDAQLTLTTPAAAPLPALQPVTTAAAEKPALQLRPVLATRAPFESDWNTTLV